MKNKTFLVSIVGAVVVAIGVWMYFSWLNTNGEVKQNVTIGILYKGASFKEVSDGFIDGMRDVTPFDKRVEYVIKEVSGVEQSSFDAEAQALVDGGVNLIFAVALEPIAAAKKATAESKVPVVFALGGNPIFAGFIDSFQPKENLTGVTWLAWELSGKRLEILHNIIPDMKSIIVIGKNGSKGTEVSLQSLNSVAERLKISVIVKEISTLEELQKALAGISHGDTDAIFYAPDPFLQRNSDLFIKRAREEKIPIMFHEERFVKEGATVAYGPNFYDAGKRAAKIAGKIVFENVLPQNTVVETISGTRLSINLVNAKAIGLEIPPDILATADLVITE